MEKINVDINIFNKERYLPALKNNNKIFINIYEGEIIIDREKQEIVFINRDYKSILNYKNNLILIDGNEIKIKIVEKMVQIDKILIIYEFDGIRHFFSYKEV